MNRRTLRITLLSALLSVMSFSVWAACGDSTCGWEDGGFVCEAETAGGGSVTCTEDNPCNIDCS